MFCFKKNFLILRGFLSVLNLSIARWWLIGFNWGNFQINYLLIFFKCVQILKSFCIMRNILFVHLSCITKRVYCIIFYLKSYNYRWNFVVIFLESCFLLRQLIHEPKRKYINLFRWHSFYSKAYTISLEWKVFLKLISAMVIDINFQFFTLRCKNRIANWNYLFLENIKMENLCIWIPFLPN